MLFKDLPEYIQKIALKERERQIKLNTREMIYDDWYKDFKEYGDGSNGLLSMCLRFTDSKRGREFWNKIYRGDFSILDKYLSLKEKAKGVRKPTVILRSKKEPTKFSEYPERVQEIIKEEIKTSYLGFPNIIKENTSNAEKDNNLSTVMELIGWSGSRQGGNTRSMVYHGDYRLLYEQHLLHNQPPKC